MTITYPINLPHFPGYKRWSITNRDVVGVNESEFDLSEQVYAWPGAQWRLNVDLPPLIKLTEKQANPLNLDPNTTHINNWYNSFGNAGTIETVGDGVTGASVLRSSTGNRCDYVNRDFIPVDQNKQYTVRCLFRKNAAANGSFYLYVRVYDSTDTAPGQAGGIAGNWFVPLDGVVGSTAWQRGSGSFGAGTANPFPTNATRMRVGIALNVGATLGYFEAQDIAITESYSWTARDWAAKLTTLRGKLGTFYAGDPNMKTPRGLIKTFDPLAYPRIKGASQVGSTIIVDNAYALRIGYFESGDMFHMTTPRGQRLFMVLNRGDSDAIGDVSIDIWPPIQPGNSPADNADLIFWNSKGIFRLDQNYGWSVEDIMKYGVSFSAHSVV